MRPSPAASAVDENVAFSPVACADPHESFDPGGPSKHATLPTGAGIATAALAASIATFVSLPVTFRYSSSCATNPFSTPRSV